MCVFLCTIPPKRTCTVLHDRHITTLLCEEQKYKDHKITHVYSSTCVAVAMCSSQNAFLVQEKGAWQPVSARTAPSLMECLHNTASATLQPKSDSHSSRRAVVHVHLCDARGCACLALRFSTPPSFHPSAPIGSVQR